MSKPISRIAGDLVGAVLLFRSAQDGGRPDGAALRSQLLQGLDHFARGAGAAGVPAEDIEEARFALVAWADELIVTSGWSGAQDWSQNLLQTQVFNTNRAGNEFYERLYKLRPDQMAAREMYFLCLLLGFQGQYMDQDAQRQEVMRVQFDTLRAARRAVDSANLKPFAPAAYQLEIELDDTRGTGLFSLLLRWGALAALLFGLAWGVLFFAVQGMPQPLGS